SSGFWVLVVPASACVARRTGPARLSRCPREPCPPASTRVPLAEPSGRAGPACPERLGQTPPFADEDEPDALTAPKVCLFFLAGSAREVGTPKFPSRAFAPGRTRDGG